MAGLWTGTTLNTNILSGVFNRIHNRKAIPMVTKATPLLYSLMGREGEDGRSAYNKKLGGWMKKKNIHGDKDEVRLRGALPTFASIADGTAELTLATIGYDSDHTGSAEFILAHYGYVHGVPSSEYMRIRGNEAKTESWIDETFDYIFDGAIKKYSADLHEDSTSAVPARDQFGSWIAAVDDGNTYGTIDRTDSGNADYRSVVSSSVGSLTARKVQDVINQVKDNRGQVRVGVMNTTLFGKWQDIIQPYSQATYNKDTASWGSDHVYFAGVEWLQDRECPSGRIGLFTPKTWTLVSNDMPFTDSGLVKEPLLNAGWIINTECWLQNYIDNPNQNAKLEDVT